MPTQNAAGEGAAPSHPAVPDGVPVCNVQANGGSLVVIVTAKGLLSAGGRFQVVPVTGATPPDPEEQWTVTVPANGVDKYAMKTPAKDLKGDAIIFQINVCSHSDQQSDGVVDVTVTQDGKDCPIVEPMHFALTDIPQCQSPQDKIKPKKLTGGFAINPT